MSVCAFFLAYILWFSCPVCERFSAVNFSISSFLLDCVWWLISKEHNSAGPADRRTGEQRSSGTVGRSQSSIWGPFPISFGDATLLSFHSPLTFPQGQAQSPFLPLYGRSYCCILRLCCYRLGQSNRLLMLSHYWYIIFVSAVFWTTCIFWLDSPSDTFYLNSWTYPCLILSRF